MIHGAHVLLYSNDPEADRAFFRDVLGFRSVDAGGGWLIFALPPAELALHPMDDDEKPEHAGHELLDAVLYLMCDNLQSYLEILEKQRVSYSVVTEAPWGITTTIRLPSGGEIGLYEPRHPTALDL